ncbi:MAG TPA: hypothetical protein VLX12_05825 [Syntrophorhabdales bacterium]|nr:hypothetical protein [Syntrophorhabdales bacterium]
MESLKKTGQDGTAIDIGIKTESGSKVGMRDPKNEAGKKELWHPGKGDGKVLKEEVERNGTEDTKNTRGIDAAGTSARKGVKSVTSKLTIQMK